ncbi:ABC transporter family substrate-binding protein [Streptomyces sp. SID8380]|uniref:ABC transporter family substrate-binding protein n=1 Tax=Streptomyces sp. SID8380 TaxID=2690360 RepID=UPI001369ADB6|nr:ABC transporter family substrate-binding protein [Streptomyces sp. SID8380]MYX23944.1 ABC transporter family substrate-binding protein [Streptomyces sp. SID8380]
MSSYSGPRLRSAVFLVAGVLAVPALASCSGDGGGTHAGRVVAPDVHQAARDRVAEGGTLHWAVDRLPSTLNTFQADADTTTARVASATLPSMFHLDRQGRPARSAAYLRDAKVETTEPRQVVVYHLDPKAAWNNGRDIGADDFAAQWQALRGSDSKYWTARNAGYDRIAKVERGANAQEVRVTFAKPYADWRALFSPLYPKEVMGSAETFNDAARTGLAVSAGPFRVGKEDRKSGDLTLERDTRWWGDRAKLDGLVLRAVPAGKRVKAMLDGRVDLAPVEQDEAARVARAGKGDGGPLAPQSGPNAAGAVAADVYSRAFAKGSPEQVNRLDRQNRADLAEARAVEEAQQRSLGRYRLRKSLEPAYTQLALNGESGPLSDERVRRAVARALDRKSLAQLVLKPLGLPADPVGSHLALAGQDAYADSSGALGKQDAVEAQALLSDAGYKPAPVSGEAAKKDEAAQGKAGADADGKAGTGARTDGKAPRTDAKAPEDEARSEKSGADAGKARTAGKKAGAEKKAGAGKKAKDAAAPLAPAPVPPQSVLLHQAYAMAARPAKAAGAAGAYAPKGTPAPPRAEEKGEAAPKAGPAGVPAVLGKDGKPLTLRFVVPAGAGSAQLREVGEKIAGMVEKIGIRTQVQKVSDASYFKDHIATGDYDMALWSWPGTAFPATDARPVYGKPVPAADGSLNVDQNYTRVGTDRIDQLLDQAAGTLDAKEAGQLVKKADARIWAAAGSIPLYQRPELVAARSDLLNAGAFGFATPDWENIGFAAKGAKGAKGTKAPSGKPAGNTTAPVGE